MDENTGIMEELKNAFPRLEISMLSTKQRGNRKLIIVKGFSEIGDIDDWSVDIVYPIWWKMIEILERYESAMRDFRLLFIRGNQFMFHSPYLGFGDVFGGFSKPLRKDAYGDYAHRHYIGECQNINDVMEYLTSMQVRF
jgi:hypothetical protein